MPSTRVADPVASQPAIELRATALARPEAEIKVSPEQPEDDLVFVDPISIRNEVCDWWKQSRRVRTAHPNPPRA